MLRGLVIVVIGVIAACSSKSSTSSPPAPAKIEPADLSKLRADPAAGFKLSFEKDDWTVGELRKYDGDWSSKYDVWPWDPAWPSDVEAFAAKLPEKDFIDDSFTYAVTKTSITDDAWEFRGTNTYAGETKPVFLLVRTIHGKRFLCKGRSVEDERAMNAAIASCRGLTLDAR
jgi:hypothetical protein